MLNDFIRTFLVSPENLFYFVFSVCLSIFLGFSIALVYKFTHRTMNYETSFFSTLTLLAPIVTIVMFYIQGDLVLSLGLVGSLSIIRFRTPIKDTRDMVFLFWTIAIGLGSGTFNWSLVIVATIIIGTILLLFYYFKDGQDFHKEYVLIVNGDNDNIMGELSKLIKKHVSHSQIRSHEVSEDDWEIIYELRLEKEHKEKVDELIKKIHKIKNVKKVSLLAPQLPLPM